MASSQFIGHAQPPTPAASQLRLAGSRTAQVGVVEGAEQVDARNFRCVRQDVLNRVPRVAIVIGGWRDRKMAVRR